MRALALRRTTQAPNGRALAYPQQYSRRTATACRNRRAPPSSARFQVTRYEAPMELIDFHS